MKKSCIIAFGAMLISLNLFAQRSDLGLVYGANDLYRLNLEYRKPINEEYKLKFGFIQGANQREYYGLYGDLQIVSDSLLVERFKSKNQIQFTFSTGVEKRLKESMFSVGLDLLVSYLHVKDGYYNMVRELSDNNEWVNTVSMYSMNDPARAERKVNFINPGLQFKFSMDIPIEDVFFLHLFIGQIISTPIYMNEKIEKDPFNEFQSQKNSFQFNSTSQAGIGLRYRFK